MKQEGIEINFKERTIKGYLLKKGKPLKQRLREQIELLKELIS